MRKFFYWYLPLVVALTATAVFAAGFYSYLRGDIGTSVALIPPKSSQLPASQQPLITPIILGDSLARGAGDMSGLGIGGRLDQELRRRGIRAQHTVNLGVNGARTADLLRQLDSRNVQTVLAQSNVIIISIGGNDLGVTVDLRNAQPVNAESVENGVLDRVGQIVKRVRDASPHARIFFVGLYNPYATSPRGRLITALVNRWNAKLIDRFSTDPNVFVVQTIDIIANHNRLAMDNFHPGDEGYALIARRIADGV